MYAYVIVYVLHIYVYVNIYMLASTYMHIHVYIYAIYMCTNICMYKFIYIDSGYGSRGGGGCGHHRYGT